MVREFLNCFKLFLNYLLSNLSLERNGTKWSEAKLIERSDSGVRATEKRLRRLGLSCVLKLCTETSNKYKAVFIGHVGTNFLTGSKE